jgi:hypothetical protein
MVFDLPMGRALKRRDERHDEVAEREREPGREREREKKERDLGAASP